MTIRSSTPYGMSAYERELSRTCQTEHRDAWWVRVRKGNYSAFSGGHFTPSEYSEVHCGACVRVWRTKAAYVDHLPDRRPT